MAQLDIYTYQLKPTFRHRDDVHSFLGPLSDQLVDQMIEVIKSSPGPVLGSIIFWDAFKTYMDSKTKIAGATLIGSDFCTTSGTIDAESAIDELFKEATHKHYKATLGLS
jgi:hypothetical protein